MKFELTFEREEELDMEYYKLVAKGSYEDFKKIATIFSNVNMQKQIDGVVFGKGEIIKYEWEVYVNAKISREDTDKLVNLAKKFDLHISKDADGKFDVDLFYEEDIAYRGDDTWIIGYTISNLDQNLNPDEIVAVSISKGCDTVDDGFNVFNLAFFSKEWTEEDDIVYIEVDDGLRPVLNIIVSELIRNGHEVVSHLKEDFRFSGFIEIKCRCGNRLYASYDSSKIPFKIHCPKCGEFWSVRIDVVSSNVHDVVLIR